MYLSGIKVPCRDDSSEVVGINEIVFAVDEVYVRSARF
jgi:hypothetical protein